MQIGPFEGSHSEKARIKVRVRLNLHGIFSVESATVRHLLIYCHLVEIFLFPEY